MASQEDCGCDNSLTDGSTDDSLPSKSDLTDIYKLLVLDELSESHTFKSIVDCAGIDRHLIIFIRHLFCTSCQQYITALKASLPPASLPSQTKITLISNGNPAYIAEYKQITGCPFTVFVDTDGTPLYKALRLPKSAKSGAQPAYITSSIKSSVFSFVKQIMSAGRKGVQGMNAWQNGGEFLFERRDDGMECVWTHRMRNTRDHTETKLLRELISTGGIDGSSRLETGLEWAERARKERVQQEKRYRGKMNGMLGSGT